MTVLAPPNPKLPMPKLEVWTFHWCRGCRGLTAEGRCLRIYEQNRTCDQQASLREEARS